MHLKRRSTRSAAAALVAAAAAVTGAVPANGSDIVAPHQGHHVGPPQLSGPGNPIGHDPALAPTEEATVLEQMSQEELERGPQRSTSSEHAEGAQGTVKAQCEVTSPNPAVGSVYRANLTLDYAQHPTGGYVTFEVADHRLEVPEQAMGRDRATITMSARGGVTTTAPLTQTASSQRPSQGSGWNVFPPSQHAPVAGPASSIHVWPTGTANRQSETSLSIRVDFDHKTAIWPIPIYHLLYATWKDTYCTIDVPWTGTNVSTGGHVEDHGHWWSDKG